MRHTVARLGCFLGLSLLLVRCSSSSPPPPPPPPPAQPVSDSQPPPPASIVAVSKLRGVATEAVSDEMLKNLSAKLLSQLGGDVQALDISGTEGGCVSEQCRLNAAKTQSASQLLHTRLIQYADSCVIVSVLYDVAEQKSQWGFANALPCEGEGLEAKISELATAFANRQINPKGAAHAVVPIQHNLRDLVWASESWTEYLNTLLAQAGLTVLPASVVAGGLPQGDEPHQACGNEKCAIRLAESVSAQQSITTKVTKRRKRCSVAAAIFSVGTKTSTRSATIKGGCGAPEIAASIEQVAAALMAPGQDS